MPSPQIQTLNDSYYKGTMGFDQFVLGATLAACAYLAQTATYDQLGWNPSTLQLFPLLLLCSGQLIPDTTLSFSSARAGASPPLN